MQMLLAVPGVAPKCGRTRKALDSIRNPMGWNRGQSALRIMRWPRTFGRPMWWEV